MVNRSIKLMVLDLMIAQDIKHRPSLRGLSNLEKRRIIYAGGIKNICNELNIPGKQDMSGVIERGKQKIADREEQAYLQSVREQHKNDVY